LQLRLDYRFHLGCCYPYYHGYRHQHCSRFDRLRLSGYLVSVNKYNENTGEDTGLWVLGFGIWDFGISYRKCVWDLGSGYIGSFFPYASLGVPSLRGPVPYVPVIVRCLFGTFWRRQDRPIRHNTATTLSAAPPLAFTEALPISCIHDKQALNSHAGSFFPLTNIVTYFTMIPQSLLLVLAVFIPSLALSQESNSTGPGIFGGEDLPAMEWDGLTPYICSLGCYTPASVY
jgi:hypothetical protein